MGLGIKKRMTIYKPVALRMFLTVKSSLILQMLVSHLQILYWQLPVVTGEEDTEDWTM